MDSSLFLFVNLGLQNNLFDAAMPFITHRGYLLFIAVIAPLFFKDWRKGLLVFALGTAGFIIADNIGDILKNMFARPRPYRELLNVRLLVAPPGSFSFPSNHAATSFAAASIIGHLFRRAAIPAFFLAVLIAFSRIYVGVHYPSDVLGGAVLGGGTGGIVLLLHGVVSKRFKKQFPGAIR
jgi:undecaprenyl-diphosphatase